MRYLSTRDSKTAVTVETAIASGLAGDGGLYTPELIPHIPATEAMLDMSYGQRAAAVMAPYLDGWGTATLEGFADLAYGGQKYDSPTPAPVNKIHDGAYMLELWHGPTCAFKDMALQMLPHLLVKSLRDTGEKRTACILTATSGDTGKAALEGFCDVNGTAILVFYPRDGVSDIQRLQMTTQRGGNVMVVGVNGNFDDTQTGVKSIFSDPEMRAFVGERSSFFSSANSINWGRVLPQIVYYFSGYLDLVKSGAVTLGDSINVCVPTGNFGNILSAYFAKKMGLPIARLICASNSNDVLTEFINSGVYNRNRKFHTTFSPSMDILISSNLERMLYLLSDYDSAFIGRLMSELASNGFYKVPDSISGVMRENYYAGCCDDRRTLATIKSCFNEYGQLLDPHTAVAYAVYSDYRRETLDSTPTLIVSTASPYKFCGAVLEALGKICDSADQIQVLESLANIPAPKQLFELRDLKERFNGIVDSSGMARAVMDWIGG